MLFFRNKDIQKAIIMLTKQGVRRRIKVKLNKKTVNINGQLVEKEKFVKGIRAFKREKLRYKKQFDLLNSQNLSTRHLEKPIMSINYFKQNVKKFDAILLKNVSQKQKWTDYYTKDYDYQKENMKLMELDAESQEKYRDRIEYVKKYNNSKIRSQVIQAKVERRMKMVKK